MERLYEATIRPVITEQTERMRIALCQTSYLLTRTSHTFHFNTDSLHLACALLVKRRALSEETQTPAAPVRPSSPFLHSLLMSLMMCVSVIASVNMLFNMGFRNSLTTWACPPWIRSPIQGRKEKATNLSWIWWNMCCCLLQSWAEIVSRE